MGGFEFGEKFLHRTNPATPYIFQSLPNSFFGVGLSRYVEQALVSFGVLYNRGRFAFYREDDRPFAFLELLHEVAGAPAKCREGKNILGDVEHSRPLLSNSTF
jgi:hypothetical protein